MLGIVSAVDEYAKHHQFEQPGILFEIININKVVFIVGVPATCHSPFNILLSTNSLITVGNTTDKIKRSLFPTERQLFNGRVKDHVICSCF